MLGKSFEELRQVSCQVHTLLGEVGLIEPIDQLVLLTELRVDVGILEDQALVERAEELIEDVLLHVCRHILPLEGLFLDIPPQFQVHVRLHSLVEDHEPLLEIHQRVKRTMGLIVLLDK